MFDRPASNGGSGGPLTPEIPLSGPSRKLALQILDLFFHEVSDTVFGEIDLRLADAKFLLHLFGVPFLDHIGVENLELLGGNELFNAIESDLREIRPPFIFPDSSRRDFLVCHETGPRCASG